MTTTEPTVLVLTEAHDATADLVLRELNDRGVGFYRADTGDFPIDLELTAWHDVSGWHGRFGSAERGIDLRRVRSVYYRRPSFFTVDPAMSGPETAWSISQARHAFRGVMTALPDVLWLPDPERAADARPKPRQLAIAAACGLRTPPTLVTNRPGAVRRFADQVGGRIITKPLENVHLTEAGRYGHLWTDEVPADSWDDPAIAATAHLFQQLVPRAYEVRMTIVGGRVFAAAIHRPDDAPVDVRADRAACSYEPVQVPRDVAEAAADMLRGLGLVFGAFDFIVDPDGVWWFLELNANGQWAWIEFLRRPITTAIADLLEKGTP